MAAGRSGIIPPLHSRPRRGGRRCPVSCQVMSRYVRERGVPARTDSPGPCTQAQGGDPMIRRILRLGLILVCGGSALPGCETLQNSLRPKSDSDVVPATGSTEEPAEPADVPTPKTFFHSSRLSGAWSSEARDIERNLGVQ